MASRQIIENVTDDCDYHNCTIREYLRHRGTEVFDNGCINCDGKKNCMYKAMVEQLVNDDKPVIQFKEVQELYEGLRKKHPDITWMEASMIWIEKKGAEKFAEKYNQGVRDHHRFYEACVSPILAIA